MITYPFDRWPIIPVQTFVTSSFYDGDSLLKDKEIITRDAAQKIGVEEYEI